MGKTLGADQFKGSVSDEHRYELPALAQPLRILFFTKCLQERLFRCYGPRLLLASTYATPVIASM